MASLGDRILVRQLIGDTGYAVWADAEVDAALDRQGNVEIAAAWLLEGAASDAARCAVIQSNDQFRTDLSKIPGELREQAKQLRSIAVQVVRGTAPAQMFTVGDSTAGTVGTMDLL